MDVFTIICYLIIEIYTKQFVYYLDVFNLNNNYDTKRAKEYSKCKNYFQEFLTKYKQILKAKETRS